MRRDNSFGALFIMSKCDSHEGGVLTRDFLPCLETMPFPLNSPGTSQKATAFQVVVSREFRAESHCLLQRQLGEEALPPRK